MDIILGSSSPRRKDLLNGLGIEFKSISPEINEELIPMEKPAEYALRISEEKAGSIIKNNHTYDRPCIIITSDTIVTVDNIILGKPKNFDDAVRMLNMLSSRTHEVITTITIAIDREKSTPPSLFTDIESTGVTFKELSDEEIKNYLNNIRYEDKAGSYAIQESGEMIISGFNGSLTNIIGFPLRLFFKMISTNNLFDEIF